MLLRSIHKFALLLRKSQFLFSRINSENAEVQIFFPFPFQFTLQAEDFTHYDIRFTQQPINKNLNQNQINHMNYVLNLLQCTLNNRKCDESSKKQFIHPLLLKKCDQFKNSLKQVDFKIDFKMLPETITKSQGYMEIQFKNNENLKEHLHPKYIHQYMFQRQKEVLTIKQIPKKQKKSQEKVLEQDINNIMDQKSKKKQIRQAFNEQMKEEENSKQKIIEKLFSKIITMGTKTIKTNRHQQYITIDLVKGKLFTQTNIQNKNNGKKQVKLYSKWLYLVQKNQPESIKNSRKKILFDFQFWNRGTFLPVKRFIDFIQ